MSDTLQGTADSSWPLEPLPIVVVGSTGVGKTAVAIELSKILNGEIVNADSMQVYRGMDIGTAKPSKVEQLQTVFHLLDIANSDQQVNVSDWKLLAENAVGDISSRGKYPIICGGTGFYIKALLQDWSMASASPNTELRAVLQRRLNEIGSAEMHRELSRVDSTTAERLHPNDTFRVMRALEVFQSTGVSISAYHAQDRSVKKRRGAFQAGISLPRSEMYARIESRVDEMLQKGFVEEVRSLKSLGYSQDHAPMRSLGYKEIDAYLRGEFSFDEAVSLIKQNTRRYAKRQQTWFRADPDIFWIDAQTISSAEAATTILSKVR